MVRRSCGLCGKRLTRSSESTEQVEQEDFDLCEATQKGLEAGVYSKGILNPHHENGV